MSATSDAGAPRKRPAASRAARAQLVAATVQVLDRVRVEPRAVSGDRVTHEPRVRREQEGRQVDAAPIERELRPHRAPVAQIGGRFGELGLPDRERAGDEAGTREQSTPS